MTFSVKDESSCTGVDDVPMQVYRICGYVKAGVEFGIGRVSAEK